MIRLAIQFETSAGRHDLDDYVRGLQVDVFGYDENVLNRYLVGRIAMDQILWADAIDDGVSLFEVCDNDSQGLHDVYIILTEGEDVVRKDLKVDEPFDYVMFIYRIRLHPDLAFCRQSILQAAASLFGWMSLVVMWRDEGSFEEAELAELGFAKIAGENLIYRHSALNTKYSEEFPKGQDIDLIATPEQKQWLLKEWGDERA